jgi:hypothetical protein
MFRVAKDRVLEGKTRSFGGRKLSFRTLKHIPFRDEGGEMKDERLSNSLDDNGLGGFAESGKKRRFLSAREVLVDFFQNLRLKFFRRLLKSIEENNDFNKET